MKPLDGVKNDAHNAAQNLAAAKAKAGEAVEEAPEAPVEEEKIDFSNVVIEPLFQDQVDFETFSKSDFRAVKVIECEAVPKSKKLLKFTLDDGSGELRTILSGIHAYYEPEELIGKTCIAITNIDLPAYICKEDDAYLAHKSKGWFISDPKSFTKWFLDKVGNEHVYGEQLRRIVKYMKAWRDYKGNPLKGIEITILASNSFEKYEGRDDKSLKNTVDNIISAIEYNFHCYKPVAPYEDLFEDASATRKKSIIDGLKSLSEYLDSAINEDDERKASEKLRDKVFGNRFPLGTETNNRNYAASTAPGVLKSDGRSA